MSVNKFIGIGNLGKDPDMRFMPNGNPVANVSMAITERYRDKTGEMKDVTEWVNLVFFGKLAEIVGQYCHKGSMIYIEGKLRTEQYEKDGIVRYNTKVVCEKMQMIGGNAKAEKSEAKPVTKQVAQPMEELDDDIPF